MKPIHSLQLPLAIALRDSARFETFVAGDNQLLLDLLRAVAGGTGETQVHCWGESGTGKTHLLQAVCHVAAAAGRAAVFLPLRELREYGPRVLEGLDVLDVICLDDVGAIAGVAECEQALFHLINEVRSKQAQLVTTANANVALLGFNLPDLQSRLVWGPVFQLKALCDADKVTVLQQRARARGFELNQEAADFMLRHYPRGMTELCAQLDYLDQASLAAQRKLTVAFIKAVMAETDNSCIGGTPKNTDQSMSD